MDIDNLTIRQAREISQLFGAPAAGEVPHAYPVGSSVFVRSVTHHYTGRLVRVTDGELVLTDAAWIADDGRFADALKTGVLNEVEPYPDGEIIVARSAICDVSLWAHDLPREQK